MSVHDFANIAVGSSASVHVPVTKALKNLLGREFPIVAEEGRIVQDVGEIIRDLKSKLGSPGKRRGKKWEKWWEKEKELGGEVHTRHISSI